jgi:hypothetical protein
VEHADGKRGWCPMQIAPETTVDADDESAMIERELERALALAVESLDEDSARAIAVVLGRAAPPDLASATPTSLVALARDGDRLRCRDRGLHVQRCHGARLASGHARRLGVRLLARRRNPSRRAGRAGRGRGHLRVTDDGPSPVLLAGEEDERRDGLLHDAQRVPRCGRLRRARPRPSRWGPPHCAWRSV